MSTTGTARRPSMRLLRVAPKRSSILWSVIVPADGTRAANVETGDFDTSPIFVQLSDKPPLACFSLHGAAAHEAQWRVVKLI